MRNDKVIITRQSPLRSPLALLLVFVMTVAGGYLLYELGQQRAGYNSLTALADYSELQAENKQLTAKLKAASEQVALLETAAKVDREAYSQVEDELVALQKKISDQQEDIEFYRGIVNEKDATGLRIQDFEISRGLRADEFSVRIVLAQAFRIDRKVSGSVDVVVEGLQRGEPARIDYSDLVTKGNNGSEPLKYSFRYFQELKAPVKLPADFVPERVHVIVRPAGKTSKTVEDFFVWAVKPG